MDEIDKAEDEEAEFIFAERDSKYVVGKKETEKGKNEWKAYAEYDYMERADKYANENNIKRSATFTKRMTKHTKRKKTNLDQAYEKKLKEEEAEMAKKKDSTANSGEENLDIYVTSKLMQKVDSHSPK